MKRLMLILPFLFCTSLIAQEKHPADDGRTIKIPVIIHVLYTDNDYKFKEKRFHKCDSLSDELIHQELKDLNNDFNAKNDMSELQPEFTNLVGNANIEFVLADTIMEPGGSPGIKRLKVDNNTKNLISKSPKINPKEFFNIYIGYAGSATFAPKDDLRINFFEVGLGSHTLTHETGHWFGLWHIWGRVGSCARVLTWFKRNDQIDDTPPQKRCTDLSRSIACDKLPNRAVDKTQKANYNNFMDYNACRCMFTKKQVIAMRKYLIEKRKAMWDASKTE